MRIAHLLASPFYGGPERQVLGLASAMRKEHSSFFLTFAEGGKAKPFLEQVRNAGFDGLELRENWPHYFRAAREIAVALKTRQAEVLCTSGYKPDIIGLRAARLADVPVVAIAHGWTGATWKVRLNELLDRRLMPKFDAVVGVSQAQSDKLIATGIDPSKIATIPNAVTIHESGRLARPDRVLLDSLFSVKPKSIVVAAGRLSPEKGFDVLVAAAARAETRERDIGFVIFGEGPLREQLTRQIVHSGLERRFILPGFCDDLQSVLPTADMLVISSHTEGLPVVLLEALSAGVPTIATAVGGIPEVIEDRVDGLLVPPNNVEQLAVKIVELHDDLDMREKFQAAGPRKIAKEYNAVLQAERYEALLKRITEST